MQKGISDYPLVSVFKSVTDTTPAEEIPILQALWQINNGTHSHLVEPLRKLLAAGRTDEYAEAKKKLPSFTPCGTFDGSRKADHLKAYSGFAILDIDKLAPDQVQSVKEKVMASSLTFSVFISPSGNGLKILVRVKSKADVHTTVFNQLKRIYEQLAGVEIDKSGKDLSRLCFFSSDSKIHINEQSNYFIPTHEEPPTVKTIIRPASTADLDYRRLYDKCLTLTLNKSAFQEGNRNIFVLLLACNCNRNGIPQGIAESFIKEQFNYNDTEVSATIRSAYANNTHEHGKYLQQTPLSKNHTPSLAACAVPLHEIIRRADEEPPIPCLWSGITVGSFGFVYGPAKSCKTTLLENLAMCFAANLSSYFEYPILGGQHRVLFISLEEHWLSRANRNKKQVEYLSKQIGNSDWTTNYITNTEELPRSIHEPHEWLMLENLIKHHKANIVIIDSFTRLYAGAIEDSSTAKEISFKLRELKDRLGITLIVIHHTPKQMGKPITQDSLAGSRILSQEADFLIGINKTHDGRRYLKEISFRYRQENTDTIKVFDIDENLWLHPSVDIPEAEVLKEKDGREDESNLLLILEFIKEKTFSAKGETHTQEIQKHFVDAQVFSRQTMFTCLSKLEKQGKVEKIGRGVFKFLKD